MARLSFVRRFGVGASLVGMLGSAVWFGDVSVARVPSGAKSVPVAVHPAPRAFVTPPPAAVGGSPVVEPLDTLPADVLTEPPADVPAPEPLAERVKREDALLVKPEMEGFDSKLSVEDPSGRSERGTTFNNVDGTQSTVFSQHLVHYKDSAGR